MILPHDYRFPPCCLSVRPAQRYRIGIPDIHQPVHHSSPCMIALRVEGVKLRLDRVNPARIRLDQPSALLLEVVELGADEGCVSDDDLPGGDRTPRDDADEGSVSDDDLPGGDRMKGVSVTMISPAAIG